MASKSSRADRRKFTDEARILHNGSPKASRMEIARAERASVGYTYMRGSSIVKHNPDGTETVLKKMNDEGRFDLRSELNL